MKLDVNQLRYMEKDAWRTLVAVEMGMKNHEFVPAPLVDTIAGLRNGGAFKQMRGLLKNKLVHHDSSKYDGYRLTPLGYDFLAIHALVSRGALAAIGRKIGVGKESDVYEVTDEEGNLLALKLHRLGRTSFRNVKQKRDYLRSLTASYNWLHLSKLSALKEFAFMRALGEHGFPVPRAVELNRHAVLMSLVPATPLTQVRELANPHVVWRQAADIMVKLAQHGLVHCDFNEFNLLVDDDEVLTLIDFPQMVSTSHLNAVHFFDRDVDCLKRFFMRKYDFRPADAGFAELSLAAACAGGASSSAVGLDAALRASGFGAKEREEYDEATATLKGGKEDTLEEGSREGSEAEEGGSSSGSDEEGSDDDEASSSDEEEAEASSDNDAEGEAVKEQVDAAPVAAPRVEAPPLPPRAASPGSVAAAAASGDEDDEEEDDDARSVAPSISASASVGLSAREREVRERLKLEKKRAGGVRAAAAAATPHRRPNYTKDKSGAHRKGAKASTKAETAVWG